MAAYSHFVDDPRLLDDIVRLVSEELNPLDLELIADNFRNRGYAVEVREGRIATGTGEQLPEVKFSPHPDTNSLEGIDTSFGHRWTVTPAPNGKYKVLDRKLGVTAYADSPDAAKGLAARVVSHEADHTPVDPYAKEPGARPTYEKATPYPIELLRSMFPNHYLSK